MEPDLLQAFELVLEQMERLSTRSRELIAAMQRGQRLPNPELKADLDALDALDAHQQRLREMLTALWQMVGERSAH